MQNNKKDKKRGITRDSKYYVFYARYKKSTFDNKKILW